MWRPFLFRFYEKLFFEDQTLATLFVAVSMPLAHGWLFLVLYPFVGGGGEDSFGGLSFVLCVGTLCALSFSILHVG